MFSDLVQDLRYAVRQSLRSPGFAAAAILSLGLGIGANTAIFSVVDALMLKRLPVADPDRLVMVWPNTGTGVIPTASFSYPVFRALREHATGFAGIAAVWPIERSNLTVDGQIDPGQTRVVLTSGNYFSTIGITAARGRVFTLDDDRVPGGHAIAIISDALWAKRFGRAENILGRTFQLNGITYDIVGVTPAGFRGETISAPADLWVPFMMASQVMPEVPGGPYRYPTRVIARLDDGVTIAQAAAAIQPLYQQLLRDDAPPNAAPGWMDLISKWRLDLEPAAHGHSPHRRTLAQPLAILMSAVGAVLLIACANVANLLLARSSARRREMSVRVAIGASRARILRQLLAESVLLSAIGGVAGVLFAIWGTRLLMTTVEAAPVSLAGQTGGLFLDLTPDWRMFAFTAALSLLTGLLFGFAPALRGSNATLSPALTARGSGDTGGVRRFGPGKALVVSQVALSLVLLIVAGLFVRTVRNLKSQDLGFDRQHALLVWAVPGQTGRHDSAMADLWQTVRERISAIPGVVSASAINSAILHGNMPVPGQVVGYGLTIPGEPQKPTNRFGVRSFMEPRFFETLGIGMAEGREFTEADTETSPRVVIINEAMARFFFGDRPAVGRHVRIASDKHTTEIVGVVKDFVRGTPRATASAEFNTYFPYRDPEAINRGAQSRLRAMLLAVRTTGNPLSMAERVRREIRAIDSSIPILRINTVDEQLDDVLTQDRLMATLSTVFGMLALVLACVGLYGVISYAVSQRTNEIGIRLALGATAPGVLRSVMSESLLVVCAGLLLGLPIALATARFISNRLFGLEPTDPMTMGGATLLLATLAAVAGVIPARRASRVDPIIALRTE